MSLGKNKIFIAGLFALILSAAMIGLVLANSLQTLQLKLSDNLYNSGEPHPDIVLVNIDDKTLEELGEFSRWNRDYYAKVVDNLSAHNPSVIGFDFLFFTPRDAQTDQQFLNSMQSSSAEVIIGIKSERVDVIDGEVVSNGLRLPIYSERANIRYASFDALQDIDEVVRKIPIEIAALPENIRYPTLSIAVAQSFLGKNINIPVENGQMLVHFRASPQNGSYTSFSFVDVLKNDFGFFDPSNLEGKIILIGPYSDVFSDKYITPLSSTFKIAGVEIHANAVQTILEQDFLRYLSVFEKILIVLVVAFSSCYVFMFTRIRWSLAFLGGFAALYTILLPFLFGMGVIMDVIHPYVTILTAFVAIYMYRYLTEFKSKLALKNAFSRYVNPSVAHQIAENPESLQLGGAKRDITVLFTDIAHFTTISEQLSAESLVAFLNEYLEAMAEVIMAEGGTVDKFEGDAVMAFFGAPLDQPDHAMRAVRAALNMRLRLQELHKKWEQDPLLPGGEKKPLVDFRCGISSGEAIVGNIGSIERLEYPAMGDIVNLGSRLEGANKQYSTNLMMSEETLKRLGKYAIARELDLIRVVGKRQPIRVFELLGLSGEVDRNAEILLTLYNDGIGLYKERKFAEALTKFEEILKSFPDDGPSKLYQQRCAVLKDIPPAEDWDGVFDMKSK